METIKSSSNGKQLKHFNSTYCHIVVYAFSRDTSLPPSTTGGLRFSVNFFCHYFHVKKKKIKMWVIPILRQKQSLKIKKIKKWNMPF